MTEDSSQQVKFRIQRYDPEQDGQLKFQEYTVPSTRGTTILDGFIYIKENLDSTLTYRTSCRMSICGSCGVLINDYPHLACHTQIEEFDSDTITVKPLPNLPIIKDLVVDLTDFFEAHKLIKPYIIRRHDTAEMEKPTNEYAMSPEELNTFLQFTYCIKCGICVAACPTTGTDKKFPGPQALAQCFRYCADLRDDGETERLPTVSGDHGVFHCHFAGACSEVCPKGLDPGLAIQLLKRRLTSRAFGGSRKEPPSRLVTPSTETKEKVAYPEFTVKQTKKGRKEG